MNSLEHEYFFRNTSQDGLENFFGCVKACGQTNKLTPREYRTSYATMTINNITGTNSLRSNCEQDHSTSIVENIHEFILGCNKEPPKDTMEFDEFIAFDPIDNGESNQECYGSDEMVVFECDEEMNLIETNAATHHDEVIVLDLQLENETSSYFESQALSLAACSIYRKMMKFNHCLECKNVLQETEATFIQNCVTILRKLDDIIPHLCSEYSVKKKLLANIESITTDTMGGPDHDLEMALKMKELSAGYILQHFCDDVNRFLSGKTDVLPINNNHIQELAIIHRRKKKRIGKHSDIFNS